MGTLLTPGLTARGTRKPDSNADRQGGSFIPAAGLSDWIGFLFLMWRMRRKGGEKKHTRFDTQEVLLKADRLHQLFRKSQSHG